MRSTPCAQRPLKGPATSCWMASPAAARPRSICRCCAQILAQGGVDTGAVPGDRSHPAAGGAISRALRRRPSRAAFGPRPTAARARVAAGRERRGAHRDRHALGRIHAAAAPRADHRGRGARLLLQAAGRWLSLFGPRPGPDARPAGQGASGARLGHTVAGIAAQCAAGRLTLLQLPERAGSAVPPRLAILDLQGTGRAQGPGRPTAGGDANAS